jgi:REP element-mobilizing transposase RayT
MPFEIFDPQAEYAVRVGNLPHWYQPGVTYFVTFRTEDSVPQSLIKTWFARRNKCLSQHGIDARSKDWRRQLERLPQVEQQFHPLFTRAFFEYLDRGHGACDLRNPELAEIVPDSLRHFNGSRYQLGDFVVMPNHVHLIVCLMNGTEIEAQCESWKHFTATRINKLLSRTGRFWQEESFDYLVRNPEQFEHFQNYMSLNPQKAKLNPGEYLLSQML